MSHDMNPRDEDPHGECAAEIERLTRERDEWRGLAERAKTIIGRPTTPGIVYQWLADYALAAKGATSHE